MQRRRPRPVSRLLIMTIVMGALLGLTILWGDEALGFVTGQDILERLREDLARPTVAPPVAIDALPGSQPADGPGDAPARDTGVALAADGFPAAARQHVIKYTVQPGDSLFAIAEKFGVHPNTIFWANTETLQDNINLLLVGVELYILPVNGVYHLADGEQTIAEIAAAYGVAPGDILYSDFNQLSSYDSTFVPPSGLRIVVPGGRREYISWRAPIRTGTQSGSANPEGSIHPGSCRARYVGTGGSGQYLNPLGSVPYRLTNGFANWHPGVDMAADYGTPVYAAETGVVVFAGWHRDGYGELVILDHGAGWTTYYGHLSERFVGCGDQVSRGQYIGQMGMSGNATGIHLHFEIRDGDSPQNPYDFLQLNDSRSGP